MMFPSVCFYLHRSTEYFAGQVASQCVDNPRVARQDRVMRWDALFADLEAQAAALEGAERAGEIAERARGEFGALGVVDRARASIGAPLRVLLAGGHAVQGRLRRVGPDWLLLADDHGLDTVGALAGLMTVRGLGRYSATPGTAGIVESRLGLRHVLRGLARDRAPVRLLLTDGSTVEATLDRVGADFVEAAFHPAAEARRRNEVRDAGLVPLRALAGVRRVG
jgi:hypothetical protein